MVWIQLDVVSSFITNYYREPSGDAQTTLVGILVPILPLHPILSLVFREKRQSILIWPWICCRPLNLTVYLRLCIPTDRTYRPVAFLKKYPIRKRKTDCKNKGKQKEKKKERTRESKKERKKERKKGRYKGRKEERKKERKREIKKEKTRNKETREKTRKKQRKKESMK